MTISKELYNKLLIPLNKSKNCKTTNKDIPLSPLITYFEKWSGKKLELQQDNLKIIPLQNNIFAKMLASPMRLDRVSRMRLPQSLMVQTSVDLRKKEIKLNSPYDKNSLGKQHSYMLNSFDILTKHTKLNASTVVPIHLLSSNKIKLADLKFNATPALSSYKDRIIQQTIQSLLQLKHNKAGDILLTLDPDQHKLVTFPNTDGSNSQLCFNLACLGNLQQLHDAWQKDSICILSEENSKTLRNLYCALKFLD